MADPSNAFAIVTINMTVEPLTSAYGGKAYVAITTTTEVICGFTNPKDHPGQPALDSLGDAKPVVLALARPWRWVSPGTEKARIEFKTIGQMPAASLSDSFERPNDAFLDWLSAPLDDLATGGAYFTQGSDADPLNRVSTVAAWHHALENALRQPGQLGRMLGLSHFVTAKTGQTFDADDAETFANLVGAPDFDSVVAERERLVHARDALPISDEIERRFNLADYYQYTIDYDEPSIDLGNIFLLARIHRYEPRDVSSSAEHPWIDENLWIQFPDNYQYWSGRDWFSRLPMDVAEAADLPRCFAAGVKNWALSMPAATGPEGTEDIGLLDAFIRLLPGTYGFGAGWIVEGDHEIEAQYRAAPTFSTAHSVLWGMLGPVRTGGEDKYFLPKFFSPNGKISEPPKGTQAEDILNIWRDLKTFSKIDVVLSDQNYKDYTTILDKDQIKQYIVLLVKTLKAIYSDQATRELIKKLYIIATNYGDLYGDNNDVVLWLAGYSKSGAVPVDQATIDNAEKRFSSSANFSENWKAINKDLATGNGWTWTDLANFIDSLSIKLHDVKFVAALAVARWVDELNGKALKDAANSLQQRKSEAVASAQKLALPQRLTLDNMRDFWTKTSGDSDKENHTPVSVQFVRQRLKQYLENRLDAIKAGVKVFYTADGAKLSLYDRINTEINYYVQRVGGDPDKKDTDDRELGSELLVDVPQPLTFQVGAITGGAPDERDDLKQRFAGFGVLVRNCSAPRADPHWHCLTLGELLPRGARLPIGNLSDTTSEAYQRGADAVVMGHNPWRVITQAGLDGWVTSFHGAPLTARPRLLDAFDTIDSAGMTPDDPANAGNRLYDVVQIVSPYINGEFKALGEFKPLGPSRARWDKLLALAYGRRYEFVFFAQTRSGAFPPGLTYGASPTEFQLPEDSDRPALPKHDQDPRIIRLRYLRRTAVGAPKLLKDASLAARPEPAEFPLPSREEPWPVFPLAEDLVGRGVLIDPKTVYKPDGDPLGKSGYPDASNPNVLETFENRARPVADEIGHLAVLVPLSKQKDAALWAIDAEYWDKAAQAARPLRFAIAPPSVSVNDWVLWRTRNLDFPTEDWTTRNDIQEILATYHKLELKPSQAEPATDGRAPDDPAVEHLVIRVWRVFDGHERSGRTQLGTWSMELKNRMKKSDATDQMLHWQTRPLPIQITAFAYTDEADLKLDRQPGAEAPKNWGEAPISLMPKPSDMPREELILPGSAGVEFLVNQGSVYRFEFFAGVPDKYFADSGNAAGIEVARIRTLTPAFSLGPDRNKDPKEALRARLPELYTIPDGAGEQIRLVSMNVVTVEVAAAGFADSIGRDEVWDATDILASSGSLLMVGVSNSDEKGEWRFWQAKRTMLNRQLWGWTGRTYRRPIAALASNLFNEETIYIRQPSETFDGKEKAELWRKFAEEDGAWFGDRADLDSTVSMGLLAPPPLRAQGDAGGPDCCGTPAPPDDKKPVVSGEALQSGPVYRISLDHDRRAQYWRFSARLESRYIGLLAPDARNAQGRVRGGWRRILIKARPTNKLPTPKLKFILPLTEPFDLEPRPSAPVSSLLVMLEEQWGETTGFAEKLVAQVTPWTDDASKMTPPDGPLEIGIDPIVSAVAPPSSAPKDKKEILTVDAWPVGLTYDLDVDRPRPAATAFQVRLGDWLKVWKTPPHVMAQDIMAMVQFQRVSDNALTTVQAEEDVSGSYASDWTKPEWVIFNADARYWRIQSAENSFVHVNDLRMNPDGSIAHDSHGALRPALLCPNDPGEPSAMMRLLFAVVTEEIFVADGAKTEIFLAVGEVMPGVNRPNYAGYTPVPATTGGSASADPPPPRRGRKLRLLEVEMHRRASELYQDDNFKRGWEIRELANNGYNRAADWGVDEHLQTQKQNFIEAFPKDGAKHWLWRLLFPPADQNKTFTSDAVARIRRVSPPIAMTEQADSSA